MKLNVKNKKFVGSLLSLILLAVGVPNADVLADFGAGVYCSAVKCSDA